MKINIIILGTLLVLVILSCNSSPTKKAEVLLKKDVKEKAVSDNSTQVENRTFMRFIKRFKPLSLPLVIETLNIEPSFEYKANSDDNIFLKSKYLDEVYLYGILSDTSLNYKVIWLQPAEIHVPILTTFSKDGRKIDQQDLGVGGCGSDCCFDCKEYISINKALDILSVDSIKQCDCNENGPDESTYKKYVRYKKGRILATGIIKLSGIIKNK